MKKEKEKRLEDRDSEDEAETTFRESKGSQYGGSSTAGKGKDAKTVTTDKLFSYEINNATLQEEL